MPMEPPESPRPATAPSVTRGFAATYPVGSAAVAAGAAAAQSAPADPPPARTSAPRRRPAWWRRVLASPTVQSYVVVYVVAVAMLIYQPATTEQIGLALAAVLLGLLLAQWDWRTLGATGGRPWHRVLRWLAAVPVALWLVSSARTLHDEVRDLALAWAWQSPWESFAEAFGWLAAAVVFAIAVCAWLAVRSLARALLAGDLNAKAWHESVWAFAGGVTFATLPVLDPPPTDAQELLARLNVAVGMTMLLAWFYAMVRLFFQPQAARSIQEWRRGRRPLEAARRVCLIDLSDLSHLNAPGNSSPDADASDPPPAARRRTLDLLRLAHAWSELGGTMMLVRHAAHAAETQGWHARLAAQVGLLDTLFVARPEEAQRWANTWAGAGGHKEPSWADLWLRHGASAPPLLECYAPPAARGAIVQALAERDASMLFVVLPPVRREGDAAPRFTETAHAVLGALPRRRSYYLAGPEEDDSPPGVRCRRLQGDLTTASNRRALAEALSEMFQTSAVERRVAIVARARLEQRAEQLAQLLDQRTDDNGWVVEAVHYRRGERAAQCDEAIVLLDEAWRAGERDALAEAEAFEPLLATVGSVIVIVEGRAEETPERLTPPRTVVQPALRRFTDTAVWIALRFDREPGWTALARVVLGHAVLAPAAPTTAEAALGTAEAAPSAAETALGTAEAAPSAAEAAPDAAANKAPATGPPVFICYRRRDSGAYAARLYDDLAARFGRGMFLIDIESLDPGETSRRTIERVLNDAAVVLVLIGRGWLGPDETARLFDPADAVRVELEAALRTDKPIMPVLVGGARMPAPEQLPAALRSLVQRQALELRDDSWPADIERLAYGISRWLQPPGAPDQASTPAA